MFKIYYIFIIILMLMQIFTIIIPDMHPYFVPHTRTSLMKITFRYTGVKIWKRFSGNINHKVLIGSFKINPKIYYV